MTDLAATQAPVRIAILECDTPVPAVVEHYGSYGRIFTTLLNSAARALDWSPTRQLETSFFDVVTAQAYPDLDHIDAVLLSGSQHTAYHTDAWILKLLAFTQKVLQHDRVRIIGVCFGHQMVALAAGGSVGRSDDGWEVSVLPVHLTAKGKEIFQQDSLAIQQMHRDIVLHCPDGMHNLGASPRCLVQGMYQKGKLITVQGHPEFNQDIVTHVVHARHQRGIFHDEAVRDALARAGQPHDGLVIAQAFLRFLLD